MLDDPNVGKINHDALPDYIAGLKNAVAELRAGEAHDKLMDMSEIVIKDDQTPVLIWAWFTIPGTAQFKTPSRPMPKVGLWATAKKS